MFDYDRKYYMIRALINWVRISMFSLIGKTTLIFPIPMQEIDLVPLFELVKHLYFGGKLRKVKHIPLELEEAKG